MRIKLTILRIKKPHFFTLDSPDTRNLRSCELYMSVYCFLCVSSSYSFRFSISELAMCMALTRLLQTTLFLVASPILVKSMFFSDRSSPTCPSRSFFISVFLQGAAEKSNPMPYLVDIPTTNLNFYKKIYTAILQSYLGAYI